MLLDWESCYFIGLSRHRWLYKFDSVDWIIYCDTFLPITTENWDTQKDYVIL